MSIDVDDIAPPSGNAWKPEVGDKVQGTIIYAGTSVRLSQFTGKNEESIRIDLAVDGGEVVSVYAVKNTDTDGGGYAKRDAKAIAAAVRAAGSRSLEVGGTLAMKRITDVPTDRGAAKAYVAEYKAPAKAPEVADDSNDGAVSGLID